MLIGRDNEKIELETALESDKSEFVAVYGRRRVGKTFLIREVCNYSFAFEHTGIKSVKSEDGQTNLSKSDGMKYQLAEFAESLRRYGQNKIKRLKSWREAFLKLSELLERKPSGRKIVFLDECPWMDTPRSDFLPALDHFWNGWCTMRKDIVLIICGSAASWVVGQIDGDIGGLHNRLTRHIYLRPFNLGECRRFAEAKGLVMTRTQLLECYMIFGGVAYYWDLLRKDQGLAQNIDRLLFARGGALADEYSHLYRALFRKPEPYMAVVRALGTKKCGMNRDEIIAETGLVGNGKLTEVLRTLEQCDFIRAYSLPNKAKNDRIYQLIDNFTLFYFKFMDGVVNPMPNFWSAAEQTQAVRIWCGHAFERVALQHIDQIKAKLGISGVITRVFGWRYRAADDGDSGTQIDLVIDRDDRVTNLCEVKYRKGEFAIDEKYDLQLQTRRETFIAETGTANAVHLTMITVNGVRRNSYWNDIQSEVTLDDLFAL